MVLLPHADKSPLGRNEVELEIAGPVDPTPTSEVCLIGVEGVPRIWSNESADEILVSSAGLDAVIGFVAGLVAVIDFLAGLGGAFFGVVVALRVTRLCKHEVSLCIVWTSSSFNFASSVGHRSSQEFSASVLKMSVNCHLSGRCQLMSETNCARINVRSMSVDARDSMSET